MLGRALKGAIGAALALVVTASAAPSRAESTSAKGALSLNATLGMNSTQGNCAVPPELPPDSFCALRTGNGVVSGLGQVLEAYTFYAHDCSSGFRVLETTVRFDVLGKGRLELRADRDEDCVNSALIATRTFTVSGGSGVYAGASGGGSVRHDGYYTSTGIASGTDTWAGTLSVTGLEFDVTGPNLSGVVNKTVQAPRKAKRVRVTYRVAARDEVDGVVPVTCKPKSGTRFRIGRTVVKCSASDTSGNTKSARFTVRVKARRA